MNKKEWHEQCRRAKMVAIKKLQNADPEGWMLCVKDKYTGEMQCNYTFGEGLLFMLYDQVTRNPQFIEGLKKFISDYESGELDKFIQGFPDPRTMN